MTPMDQRSFNACKLTSQRSDILIRQTVKTAHGFQRFPVKDPFLALVH